MPDLRIVIGHGQLPERQLEQVMIDFAEHKYDILLATTIIESGIDIPNTNTIIVNRADMFGLAQLYQIRGRVGRSNKRAYAYLMIPNQLSDVARKRLETLTEYESLGAGYQIAMRDLEIRGAGTLLGNKQSGVITSVGFNYYNKLLDQAVKNIVEENPKGLWHEDEEKDELRLIELDLDFYFPADYIADEKQKLQIYKRMVEFVQVEEFDELAVELKDRFGEIPELAKNVLDYFKMRMLTRDLGLKTFLLAYNKMVLEYDAKNMPPRQILANLIGWSEVPISFDTTSGLKIVFEFDEKMAKDRRRKIEFGNKVIDKMREV
jgi:transcription-repair coupling factor (superfamily II helicase)